MVVNNRRSDSVIFQTEDIINGNIYGTRMANCNIETNVDTIIIESVGEIEDLIFKLAALRNMIVERRGKCNGRK